MSYFSTTRSKVAAGAAAGAIVVLGGGAAAWAATSSGGSVATSTPPAPSTTSPPATPGAHGGHGGRKAGSIFDRSDHGTVEVKQAGHWVTYTYDRGKVSAASATSITIARPDGQSTTVAINGATKFRGVASATAVQTNQNATVISLNGTATQVVQGHGKAPASSGGAAPTTSPPST